MGKHDELIEKYKKAFLNNSETTGDCQGFGSKKGRVEKVGHTACHSFMHDITGYDTIGTRIKRRENVREEGIAFIEWLVSPKSIYHSFIKYLGDDFHVVRDDSGLIIGIVVTRLDVNNRVLMSLFKATRDVSEHAVVIPFWYKWAVKRRKNPALAFMLCHFVDSKGSKMNTGHSVLDGENNNFAVHRALNLDHTDWDFEANPANNTRGYDGENRYMWSGRFDVHTCIPKVGGKKEVPTTFWKKYYGVAVGGYTEETLENFFDNAEEICKDYL